MAWNKLVIAMLTQPKLVKNSPQEKKKINLKGQPSSRARFLLGLNNKVSHIDKRLTRLEHTTDHLLRFSIGYKELGLTFVLSLLVFTSITLALREYQTASHINLNTLLNNPELISKLLEQNRTTSKAVTPEVRHTRPSLNPLKWPLERQPSISEIDYTNHKHGIELEAKLGDPIVAIDHGKVLYSGDAINSYGNLILIQHANDIISVYGNNYSNYVSEGEVIKKGQLIAAVGEGNGKQPRLYFEIRYKGKAQDPFMYFKE